MKKYLEQFVKDGIMIKDAEGLYIPNHEHGYEFTVTHNTFIVSQDIIISYFEYTDDRLIAYYFEGDVLDADGGDVLWIEVYRPADVKYSHTKFFTMGE